MFKFIHTSASMKRASISSLKCAINNCRMLLGVPWKPGRTALTLSFVDFKLKKSVRALPCSSMPTSIFRRTLTSVSVSKWAQMLWRGKEEEERPLRPQQLKGRCWNGIDHFSLKIVCCTKICLHFSTIHTCHALTGKKLHHFFFPSL